MSVRIEWKKEKTLKLKWINYMINSANVDTHIRPTQVVRIHIRLTQVMWIHIRLTQGCGYTY